MSVQLTLVSDVEEVPLLKALRNKIAFVILTVKKKEKNVYFITLARAKM